MFVHGRCMFDYWTATIPNVVYSIIIAEKICSFVLYILMTACFHCNASTTQNTWVHSEQHLKTFSHDKKCYKRVKKQKQKTNKQTYMIDETLLLARQLQATVTMCHWRFVITMLVDPYKLKPSVSGGCLNQWCDEMT